MNTENQSAASDVSEQTEPENKATEQTTESTSFEEALLRAAREDGHTIGDEPEKTEPEAKTTEVEPEVEETETDTETEPKTEGETEGVDAKVEPEKEEKPEHKSIPEQIAEAKAKGEKPAWYLSRIAEESQKARDRLDRAEKAETLANQLQAQLSKVVAPQPTEDNPFLDINDVGSLDRLERSYEKAIDLADENPDGATDVLVGTKDGQEIRRDFTPEELAIAKRKAEKAIRKSIPERRTYLQQRAVADAQAVDFYPDYKNPDSEFTQVATVAVRKIMSGQAAKDPDILVSVGDYVRGYLARIKNGNGKTEPEKTPEVKKILESSKQKVAPTPTRSRSLPEKRGPSSADLAKAEQNLKEEGTEEAALAYLNATGFGLGKSGGAKKVESISE